MSYESAAEWFTDQAQLLASPLALLLAARGGRGRRGVDQLRLSLPMPEQDSIHHVGGSAWGIEVLLALLVFMVTTPTGSGSTGPSRGYIVRHWGHSRHFENISLF
uniref:Uncharacterized protein n=1 Tax=Oryza punctata TaxID=4537 RepID=A0A0E0JMD7_ORYPU